MMVKIGFTLYRQHMLHALEVVHVVQISRQVLQSPSLIQSASSGREHQIAALRWIKDDLDRRGEEEYVVVTLWGRQHKGKVILHYRSGNQEDYRVDFLSLFAQCARSSHVEEYWSLADHRRGKRSSRGLERHINWIFPHYKNNYVEKVLDIQSKMPSDMIPELKARLLCARATQLSKPSRNLARFLAHQDAAMEVANQVREELLHDSLSTL